MRYATIALILPVLLAGCATGHSDLIIPDVVNYPENTQSLAANEMESRSCPILSDVMMPDYQVMRDQARRAKKALN